ncbi:MAG: nitroreductase family protein [Actinobacteria bacterium]|nr:MAG: nitroreductase family protein [Actinomycetota bacterium]
METLEAILTRRSIRRYTGDGIESEDLKKLLEAAMAAPSAGNQQPWQFIAITDRQLLKRIPDVHPHAQMVPSAAAGIVVCADTTSERYPDYWIQDSAAATQNILLAAHGIGLGAVWLGIHPRQARVEAFRELFGIPAHVTPLSMVSIGHPAERKPPANRFDPARIHYNVW